MKGRREYLCLLEKSLNATRSSIAAFNRVYDKYKIETCLILMTNGWELLGKAVLVKKHGRNSIVKDKNGNTSSAEHVVSKLCAEGFIDENQEESIQQIVSLRNQAIHGFLPAIPTEILYHLFYFGAKFYKDLVLKKFPKQGKVLVDNFLSISFDNLTTYADKVQSVVSRMKKSKENMRLVWLLERGISYDGLKYISQDKFERQYKDKRKVMSHLHIGKFIQNAEMVRIVPVQAPKNFTADLILRKGSSAEAGLPVHIKKTEVEKDYPYLTSDIGVKIGKTQNFVAYAFKKLNYKGNDRYHQSIRISKKGRINRYSEIASNDLKKYLDANPGFDPYR